MKVGNALFKLEGGDLGKPAKLGFQWIFHFHPHFEEDFQFDEHIFQMGWFNHQPDPGFSTTSFLLNFS